MPYMSMAYNLGAINVADPTWAWAQLRTNPWLAMAIYEDMEEKDSKVGSDLEVRIESVLSKDRQMLPASEKRQDKKIAEFVWETLETYMGGSVVGERLPFDNLLFEMMDAVAKGVAIGEIIWNHTHDRVFAENINFHPQHLFSFGEGEFAQYATYAYPQRGPLRLNSNLQFAVPGLNPEQPLPQNKFLVHTFSRSPGQPLGDAGVSALLLAVVD